MTPPDGADAVVVLEHCPECGSGLRLKTNRRTLEPFVACGGFPSCHFSQPYIEREDRMARRIMHLEERIEALEQRDLGMDADLRRNLRKLIATWHPDRNPSGLDANRVVGVLNAWRAELK